MTAGTDQALSEALAPVRAALLATARHDADQRVASAHARAAEILAAARERAEGINSAARDAGIADAETVFATEQARSRRAARARTLRARREAYEQLRLRSREAVVGMRGEPGYAAIRATLTTAGSRLLGPAAEIVEADGGGVIARSAGRRVDLSLTAFADRAVDAVAPGLDQP